MRVIPCILAIALAKACGALSIGNSDASSVTAENYAYENKINSSGSLYYISTTLENAGIIGRIYYVGTCDTDGGRFPPEFPKLSLKRSSNAVVGITDIRNIFSDDPDVEVTTSSADKIVRVWIGKVSNVFLKTGIATVRFDPTEQYNAAFAIGAIGQVEEVQRSKHALGMVEVALPFDYRVLQPADWLPHLPEYLAGTTLDGALDAVAETFRGIVVYGECERPRTVSIQFIKYGAFINTTPSVRALNPG